MFPPESARQAATQHEQQINGFSPYYLGFATYMN